MRSIFLLSICLFLSSCDDVPYDPKLDLEGGHAQHVDNPDAKKTVVRSPLLQSYSSCKNLNDEMRRATLEKMHADFARKLKNPPRDMPHVTCGSADKAMPAPMAPSSQAEAMPAPKAALVEGVDFSGANNQEKGVDEADIIKLDGKYFYILSKSTLTILAIPEFGKLEPASVINLATPGTSLLLKGDQALVLAQENALNTRVDIIDLGLDRKNPSISESYFVPGEIVSARRIGENYHLATFVSTHIDGLENYVRVPDGYYELSEEEQDKIWAEHVAKVVKHNEEIIAKFDFLTLVPRGFYKQNSELKPKALSESDCAQTFGQESTSENGFLNLISLTPQDNNKKSLELSINRVRGNKPIVYASQNQFILASRDHEPWWFDNNEEQLDNTSIHRFDLSLGKFPVYQDSVSVPGKINNSFSLSEHKGYLRVATTTNLERWWSRDNKEPEKEQNNLYILGNKDNKFSIVGSLEGLAPGEKIWAARFTNDLCFLVTFKQVDPLFTLDLSDPFKPKVVGELKVPGVSTYLQDIGEGKLLAIGYGGDKDGLDFNTNVSIFDVSDLKKPALLSNLSFAASEKTDNNHGISSEANKNHLAINYFAPKAMTAIPLSISRFVANPLDPAGGKHENITKLAIVNTKPGEALKMHGHVDHSKFYQNSQEWSSYNPPAIRRSYFVGDYIYAISPKGITGSRLSDMQTISGYEL